MVDYNSEDLENHDAIGVIIKDYSGNILMQDHVKFDFWTIPIGKAKPDQSPENCAKQEVFEECNLIVNNLKLLVSQKYSYIRNGKKVFVNLYLFEALNFSGVLYNKEPKKHRKLEYMSIDEISKLNKISDATMLFLKLHGITRTDRVYV